MAKAVEHYWNTVLEPGIGPRSFLVLNVFIKMTIFLGNPTCFPTLLKGT